MRREGPDILRCPGLLFICDADYLRISVASGSAGYAALRPGLILRDNTVASRHSARSRRGSTDLSPCCHDNRNYASCLPHFTHTAAALIEPRIFVNANDHELTSALLSQRLKSCARVQFKPEASGSRACPFAFQVAVTVDRQKAPRLERIAALVTFAMARVRVALFSIRIRI